MTRTPMPKADAIAFLAAFYHGEHHIPGKVRPWGYGWEVNTREDFGTFDFNNMTRLVFLAHDRAVRVCLAPAGRYLKIVMHQREREGDTYTRHPTIEAALETWRANHPADGVKK